jgi:outer membrane protein assembly factor BamA
VKEAQGSTITSLIGLNLNYNSLDNIQAPRNGFVAELKPEYAGVGGDSKFLRVAADARYYRELFDDVVGFVRLQGGHVQATSGDLRMIDHYFLGSNLVRGFSSFRHRSARRADRQRARRHDLCRRYARNAVPAAGPAARCRPARRDLRRCRYAVRL